MIWQAHQTPMTTKSKTSGHKSRVWYDPK